MHALYTTNAWAMKDIIKTAVMSAIVTALQGMDDQACVIKPLQFLSKPYSTLTVLVAEV